MIATMSGAQSHAERAFDQVVEWLEHFEDVRRSGKVWYPLEEVLLLSTIAIGQISIVFAMILQWRIRVDRIFALRGR